MAIIHDAAAFLYDSGLLGEINRVVLHPRGLALAINHETTEGGPEGKTRALSIGGVLRTDDPEGYEFSDLDLVTIRRKLEDAGLFDPLPSREKALGYVVQPLPSTKAEQKAALAARAAPELAEALREVERELDAVLAGTVTLDAETLLATVSAALAKAEGR